MCVHVHIHLHVYLFLHILKFISFHQFLIKHDILFFSLSILLTAYSDSEKTYGCLGYSVEWKKECYKRVSTLGESVLEKEKVYLFLAVLGLPCCVGLYLVVVSRGYFLVAVCGLLLF